MKKALWLVLMAGCAHEGPVAERPVEPAIEVPVAADAEVRAVTTQFVEAAERADFAAVFSMLSGALRDRYTPERLARDFEAEPLSKERLARIRAALNQPFTMSASKAVLTMGATSAFTLVHEADGWRVASLE